MSDSEGVIEESPTSQAADPSDMEAMMVSALADTEDSSTSETPDVQGEAEPDSDESAAAKTDAEDAKVEAKTEENVPKDKFLKRVNGLQAAKRKAEDRNLGFEKQLGEYREAFSILQNRAFDAEQRLREYEEADPRDVQIQQMQQQTQAQQIRQKLEAEHQQRVVAMQRQSQVEERADQIVETANALADKYPTITAEEVVYKFRNSDKSMEDLAKDMHASRYEHYKNRLAKEHKRPKAPRSLKPQGGMVPVNGHSEDDLVDFLSAIRS